MRERPLQAHEINKISRSEFLNPGRINPGIYGVGIHGGWRRTRRLSAEQAYSLSVIRIRPSPVTTGPLAVSAT
jgi:hypothetical protein